MANLQEQYNIIREEGQSYVAESIIKAEKDLDQSIMRRVLLIGGSIVVIIGSIVLVLWDLQRKITYDGCFNRCTIASIQKGDGRSCTQECAKYKK